MHKKNRKHLGHAKCTDTLVWDAGQRSNPSLKRKKKEIKKFTKEKDTALILGPWIIDVFTLGTIDLYST